MIYKIKGKQVTRDEAKAYVEKLWGTGKLEQREQEAREYFSEECDNVCEWADGFAITY